MAEINQFGEIVRVGAIEKERTQEDLLREELSRLQYEIFNNHHNPDKSLEKLARYHELQKILGMDLEQGDKAVAMKRAQLKVQAKIQSQGKPSLQELAAQLKKQND